MKILKEMFLSRYDLWVKYLVNNQMTYLEQMQTKLLSNSGFGC